MKISQAYPSKYLRASDINGSVTRTIANVILEDVGENGSKPVLYFHGERRGLVLNKTNAMRIAAMHGDDTDAWIGKSIVLEVEQVPFRGDLVSSIRVRTEGAFRAERRPPTAVESQIAAQAPLTRDELDDEIPFAWAGALLVPWALALLSGGAAL